MERQRLKGNLIIYKVLLLFLALFPTYCYSIESKIAEENCTPLLRLAPGIDYKEMPERVFCSKNSEEQFKSKVVLGYHFEGPIDLIYQDKSLELTFKDLLLVNTTFHLLYVGKPKREENSGTIDWIAAYLNESYSSLDEIVPRIEELSLVLKKKGMIMQENGRYTKSFGEIREWLKGKDSSVIRGAIVYSYEKYQTLVKIGLKRDNRMIFHPVIYFMDTENKTD